MRAAIALMILDFLPSRTHRFVIASKAARNGAARAQSLRASILFALGFPGRRFIGSLPESLGFSGAADLMLFQPIGDCEEADYRADLQ
ncbi:hypothetical protein B5K11_17805 [Rhizobium leguminosarum bv. trifolii]|uniref:hypothetical protein n=1 Tax=Rhizobium leguminosarum TaxID=384 RepID=UPI000E2F613E|nr:hypothetical protein [Rhizobium leguminosarum]RFB90956.1 hypothetical protein B5K11_17805 [Rhizobium leguminosarum bv. trifolii]